MNLAEVFMTYWIKLTWNKHKKFTKEYQYLVGVTHKISDFLKKYEIDVEIYSNALVRTYYMYEGTYQQNGLLERINNTVVLSKRINAKRKEVRPLLGFTLRKPFEAMKERECIEQINTVIIYLHFCITVINENIDKVPFEDYDDFYIYFSKNIRVLDTMKDDILNKNRDMNYLKLL